MACRLDALLIDSRDPQAQARFWAGLLDRTVVGARVLGPGNEVVLAFVQAADLPDESWLHLHVTSEDRDDQQLVVDVAEHLGASPLDVGQRPDEGHVVLADPEGNRLCVIEPGNAFLDGCGRLGEVACDGSPEVGRFWSAALAWPLVWEDGQETAIQSPEGGTKIAWGGPVEGVHRSRHRLSLVSDAVDADIDRLVHLGATLTQREGSTAQLTDPDGIGFVLQAQPSLPTP
jgi:hypothetical protein